MSSKIHTLVGILAVALALSFVGGFAASSVLPAPAPVPVAEAAGVSCNATTIRVPMFTFPDGGNHTSNQSPRWFETATPGTQTFLYVAEAGSGTSYFRAAAMLPESWTGDSNVALKIWVSSKNGSTDEVSIKHYVSAKGIGDEQGYPAGNWNIAHAHVDDEIDIGDNITEIIVEDISYSSLTAGDLIDAAIQFQGIDTDNVIYVAAAFLEVDVDY